MPLVRAGVLAGTSCNRWPALPDLPTMVEDGLPRYGAKNWYGIVAPARALQPMVMRLNQRIVKILSLADVRLRRRGAAVATAAERSFG